MLKTMSVRLSDEVTTSNDDCCKKIHDIFKVYPFVECIVIVDLSPGMQIWNARLASKFMLGAYSLL